MPFSREHKKQARRRLAPVLRSHGKIALNPAFSCPRGTVLPSPYMAFFTQGALFNNVYDKFTSKTKRALLRRSRYDFVGATEAI